MMCVVVVLQKQAQYLLLLFKGVSPPSKKVLWQNGRVAKRVRDCRGCR